MTLTNRQKKLAIIALVSAVCMAILSCSTKKGSESFVTFYTGSVTIKSGFSSPVQVQVKDQVRDGDIIRTGEKSNVVIQTTDGLVLRIEQNSEVAISSFNEIAKREISLNRGKLLSKVDKLKKGSEYSVKTLTAVASVRGTEFLTEFTGKESIVAVGRGAVSVKKRSGGPDEKIVEKETTALVSEKGVAVDIRKINRIETLELSKFEKTPVVESIETKRPEEIREIFKDTEKSDDKINFEIRADKGVPMNEIKEKFKRIDVVILFSGRVIEGVILTRGETYRIATASGVEIISAKEVKRTDVK